MRSFLPTLRALLAARRFSLQDRGVGVGTVAVRRVKPGRYKVVISATDAAGLRSATTRRVVVR
jgi:hypothetical protein